MAAHCKLIETMKYRMQYDYYRRRNLDGTADEQRDTDEPTEYWLSQVHE